MPEAAGRFSIRAMLVLLSLMLTGCGLLRGSHSTQTQSNRPTSGRSASTGSGREGRLFRDDAEGFSLRIPNDWELVQPAPAGTVMAALAPLEGSSDTFRENVNVIVEAVPAGYSEQDYVKASSQTLLKTADYVQLGKGTWKCSGHTGVWIEYTAKFVTQGMSHNRLYIVATPDRGYNLTFSSLDESYPHWESQFRQIAGTFELN